MTHILEFRKRTRDPNSRDEVCAYCGAWEECSGSGKHRMVNGTDGSDCEPCKTAFTKWLGTNMAVDW